VLKPEVAAAIREVEQTLRASTLSTREDGQGGAYVTVENVLLGHPYVQAETWVGFHLSFQYPYADVYPHFVRGDLARTDGGPLGEAMTQGSFEGRSAIQVSRRSNKLNPATDTAAIKLAKVLEWMRNRR